MVQSRHFVLASTAVLCLLSAVSGSSKAARPLPESKDVGAEFVVESGFPQAFIKAFLMVSLFLLALQVGRKARIREKDMGPERRNVQILATEMGDETFIIAAIMSMQHPRLVVYAGAMAALTFMTIISTVLGYILPNLISRQATQHAASLLYLVFGSRLLWIAWRTKPQESNQEEVDEVEQKLKEVETQQTRSSVAKIFTQFVTPALLEALILTFIAEWGDRSQIATISLAATYNPFGVTVGAVVGHALCTGTAVLGGQLLAVRISQRTVALIGGLLFLGFAAHSMLFSWKGQ